MNVNRSFPMNVRLVLFIAVALTLMGASACSYANRTAIRETQTDTDSVQLNGANSADVTIAMSAGNFTLTNGAPQLMEGKFIYNVPAWKPRVSYFVRDGKGFLNIRQSGSTGSLTFGAQNEWDINLNNSVPLNLRIQLGAGRSGLELGGLSLNKLDLTEGAGESDLDLRGNWTHSANVSIEGGTGKTVLHLPVDVGARVNVEQALGEVKAGKLMKENGAWVNSAYGKSPATLDVTIRGGIGEIDLM